MSSETDRLTDQVLESLENPATRKLIRALLSTAGIKLTVTDDVAIYCIYAASEKYLEKRGLLVDV